jgi:hypothetical protein
MKKSQAFLKLIRESRKLLSTATPEQQLRLLGIIRESYRRLQESNKQQLMLLAESDSDYLNEK